MWFDFKQTIEFKVKVLLGIIGVLSFVVFWHVSAHWNGEISPIFPGPKEVVTALYELFFEREFIHDIGSSVQRIALSFLLAVAVAVPLGVLIGSFATVSALLNPLVSAFRYLPAPAFIPLLLMWFGTGDEQKIALLFLGVIWFLVTLISDVVSNVHKDYIETSKTLGANRRLILWTVVVPASLPGIVDVCRQMLAVSWTYLVIAEIVAATDGIGAMMMRARRFVHVDDIMAGIIVIGLLGLLFDLLFRGIYWAAFPYLRKTT
ncbi:ABC transporter permease [Hydrogenovibrio thermophilus]|uniref:ABC transporter permease n=1 Tax=Hydrogenovibrio thermophilus TaxID=265883 RepID=UPI001CEF960D|nr:ABC transporter permease [Hydrogenovibrio thermophilus]